MDSAEDFARQFTAYIDATADGRADAEKARDYRDNRQWTPDQVAILGARGQAAITDNRIAPKVDFMVGVERANRADPKAYPRTPDHDEDAEAVTDALRYVADNTLLDEAFSECFEELIVEGIEVMSIDVKEVRGQMEVVPDQVHWDRFYYDPHSRERDFSDAEYLGVSAWMEPAAVKRMFPGNNSEIDGLMDPGAEAETFADRPGTFVDSKRKRIRVNRHCYKDDKGIWSVVYFAGAVVLKKPVVSPLVSADTEEPECPIIAQSLYVDRENYRYGYVKRLLDPQDEINHRKSKAQWMLSNSRAWQRGDGVIPDPQDFLNQLASARGVATVNGTKGVDWDILDNGELAAGQAALLQEAKASIDNVGVNPALSGKQGPALSGRALIAEQQGGLTELGLAFDTHRHFKLRCYRAIWSRIKQFWTEERWVRVTDEEGNAKFAGLNTPVTRGEMIVRELQARAERGQPVQPVDVNDPRMFEVVGMEREVARIDVDLIITDTPDAVNIQAEQFDQLVNMYLANPQGIPWETVIRASQLRNKREILEGQSDPEQAARLQQAQAVAEASEVSRIRNMDADTALKEARAMGERVEAAKTFQEADGQPIGPREAAEIRKINAEADRASRA